MEQNIQAVQDEILEAHHRQSFLDACDSAYAALQENPEAWWQYQAELRSFDASLMDGLRSTSAL